MDFDLGNFTESDDGVFSPSTGSDAALVPVDLLFERPTQRLNDAALNLIDQAIWINDQADIHHRPYFFNRDFFFHTDQGGDRSVACNIFVAAKAQTQTMQAIGFTLLSPPTNLSQPFKNGHRSWIAQMLQAKIQCIHRQFFCHFIHE